MFELPMSILLLTNTQDSNFFPLAIAIGGVGGAWGRYYLTTKTAQWLGNDLPYGTLLVNVSGTFLMGFFSTLGIIKVLDINFQHLILIGFLGSYTTFSTYILETANLLNQGNYHRTISYGLGSIILGEIALLLGIKVAYLQA